MSKRSLDDDDTDGSEVKLLSPKNAARQLGLSISQIYRLVERKKLEMLKLGRAVRVTQGSIDNYIKSLPRK
jgi:excisionase family DNA binding protein